MSDVIMIDNSIDQGSILVPVSAVQADFVTETGTIVYVPLASTHSPGIVTIGEGLLISPDGLLEFDRTEVTLKSLALNGKLLEPDENKHINIVLTKNDVGLDKVDNTADEDKPVSLATRAALNELDEKLTLNINNVNDDLVAHVNRVDNPHKVTKEQIGLGNVDNTSDINKPISRATKNELARIERLIKGAANIFSYDSYEALVEDVNPLDDSVFKVGQSVYIRTLNVPDLWVFSVEEEPVEFEYTTDADIENLLKTDGSFQVGYFKFAALEIGKVNLDSYVTLDTAQTIPGDKNYTGLLKLNDKPVAVKEDLDNYVTKDGYTMRASSTVGEFYYNTGTGEKAIQLKMPTIPTTIDGMSGGTLTSPIILTGDSTSNSSMILKESGQIIEDGNSSCVLGRYQGNFLVGATVFPLKLRGTNARPTYKAEGGSEVAMALYGDIPTNYVTTDTEQTISGTKKFTANNNTFTRTLILGANTPINFTGIGAGTYNIGAFVCNTTDKFGVECPRESDSASAAIIPFRVGARGGQLGILQAGNIYQNGKQVANADDLSAVKDAALSSDSKTLTITKRDGSSFNFQGGGGSDITSIDGLAGGTLIASSGDFALAVQSKAGASYIKFANNTGATLGYYGVNSLKQPVFYSNKDNVLAFKADVSKLGTTNWNVTQDGSGNLVFRYA